MAYLIYRKINPLMLVLTWSTHKNKHTLCVWVRLHTGKGYDHDHAQVNTATCVLTHPSLESAVQKLIPDHKKWYFFYLRLGLQTPRLGCLSVP